METKVKKITISIAIFFFCIGSLRADSPLEIFLQKHGNLIYQDLIIHDEIFPIGTDSCEPRYQLIKPVLDLYEDSFSVLDLGAAQGYFSFRIAHDYPKSSCVMVESNDTSYYSRHGDMLYDLCLLNSHLPNITFLQKRMNISDLSYLQRNEHFDVVIAFLVVHLMEDNLREQVEILNTLLNIGDNLIIEVANDVGVVHTSYVEYLSHALNGYYLGEVKRHKDPHSSSTGKLFWFKQKQPKQSKRNEDGLRNIQTTTFRFLNGVFPIEFQQTCS